MLISLNISDLITDIRYTLQDTQKKRWEDEEIYGYINQGLRRIALKTKYLLVTDTLNVVSGTTEYTLTKEAIEFYNIDTEQTFEITDAKTLTFEDPEDEEVEVEYYAYPDRIVYGADTTLLLDEDIQDMLRYFVLSRCYEKEANAENISKAAYFDKKFNECIADNSTRYHSKTNGDTVHRTDYYY